eukprot:g22492.t1
MSSTSADMPRVAVAGGGLAGALLAVYLRRARYQVDVYEAGPDLRLESKSAGRSINLVLTSRGLSALDKVGLAGNVLRITTPVYGRTIHARDGSLTYQPYGPDLTYRNFSVSRTELNQCLLDAAEEAGARLHFDYRVDHLDIPNGVLYSYLQQPGQHPWQRSARAQHVLATDGASSRCRQALKGLLGDEMQDQGIPLNSSYKELLMPARAGGQYAMDHKSLHIWPRGSHFLMGLPNLDGSFTMTLYAPATGAEISFAAFNMPEKFSQYFSSFYPDAVPLMPDVVKEFFSRPAGFLGTIKAGPWCWRDKLCLVGDAAHAIVPFFGQGCNAAFEGVQLLSVLMNQWGVHNVGAAFRQYSQEYKKNGDAIAQMAMENYYEMMDKSGDSRFQLQKQVEIRIAQHMPGVYVSRYAMVTHSLIPYQLCLQIGLIQQRILDELTPKNVTSASQVSMQEAQKVVERLLVPFLKQYAIDAHSYQDPVEDIVQKAKSVATRAKSHGRIRYSRSGSGKYFRLIWVTSEDDTYGRGRVASILSIVTSRMAQLEVSTDVTRLL